MTAFSLHETTETADSVEESKDGKVSHLRNLRAPLYPRLAPNLIAPRSPTANMKRDRTIPQPAGIWNLLRPGNYS